MKLPNFEIEAQRTENGGFTQEALARWGVPWPPPKGWKKALETEGRREVGPPEGEVIRERG